MSLHLLVYGLLALWTIGCSSSSVVQPIAAPMPVTARETVHWSELAQQGVHTQYMGGFGCLKFSVPAETLGVFVAEIAPDYGWQYVETTKKKPLLDTGGLGVSFMVEITGKKRSKWCLAFCDEVWIFHEAPSFHGIRTHHGCTLSVCRWGGRRTTDRRWLSLTVLSCEWMQGPGK